MADDEDYPGNVIDMSAARQAYSWMSRLLRNKDGATLPTASNAIVIFNNDPALQGLLRFNAFRTEYLVMRAPPVPDLGVEPQAGPYPRAWTTEDVILIQTYFQRVWSPKFGRDTIEDAMVAIAASFRFHPVCDWLDTLRWDRLPRIDKWLSIVFGCQPTAYHKAIGAKLLIAAVRRVRHPGCKFDHLLVLEGPQGIGKSTCVRKLFSDAWFTDDMPADLKSRDAAQALCGVWCVEFAEIEHLIRAEVETIKSFLSRSVDRYRPPYGKTFIERPRQGILIGTTNKDDYLRDDSGNRRIWPVRCTIADVTYIDLNRDQLWAEASYREAMGEPIWIDDTLVAQEAQSAQQQRMADDVWMDAVSDYLKYRREVKLSDVLSNALEIPKDRQDKRVQMRVGRIMHQLNWEKSIAWKGKTSRVWVPKENEPETGGKEG